MSTFGQRLKQLRCEHNLTQDELAKSIKISKSSINMYERGEREPKFETLEAIADYFNVDMDYLLGRSDTPNTIKRSFDLFSQRPITREELAVAIYHVLENKPLNLNKYPENHRDAIERMCSFLFLIETLPPQKREEVTRYIQFISSEEKRSKD